MINIIRYGGQKEKQKEIWWGKYICDTSNNLWDSQNKNIPCYNDCRLQYFICLWYTLILRYFVTSVEILTVGLQLSATDTPSDTEDSYSIFKKV